MAFFDMSFKSSDWYTQFARCVLHYTHKVPVMSSTNEFRQSFTVMSSTNEFRQSFTVVVCAQALRGCQEVILQRTLDFPTAQDLSPVLLRILAQLAGVAATLCVILNCITLYLQTHRPSDYRSKLKMSSIKVILGSHVENSIKGTVFTL